MSRIFEALQHANPELKHLAGDAEENPHQTSPLLATLTGAQDALEDVPTFALPQLPASRLVAWTDPSSVAAESLRVVSSRLRHTRQRRTLKTLLVTSAVRGDGKSITSANLAVTLAMYGERTLLIDGDLHKPTLASTFRSGNGAGGFAGWHSSGSRITKLLQRAESAPLWFLPSGICRSQPVTLIQSEKTVELLKQLSTWFSWIVIDSPPLVPLVDASVWATLSDGILLVARQGLTPKRPFKKAVASLDHSKLLAVIMNDAESSEERYYRSYYAVKKNASVESSLG